MLLRLIALLACVTSLSASPPSPLLEEDFRNPLSAEWYWGLGTWTAGDGVLRGFESGPRRHGPVKVRRLELADAVVECEFRLIGKASFAGLIFNGNPERGHLFHLVMSRERLRLLVHPRKGESLDLASVPGPLTAETWHRVRLEFRGMELRATVDDRELTASHACLAEPKLTFGLGGESGGPEGEAAGALEFRRLRITPLP